MQYFVVQGYQTIYFHFCQLHLGYYFDLFYHQYRFLDRSALTRVINKYANEHNLLKKNKFTISGDDIKEGLSCILSTKIPDPKFSSQTKDKLVSSEVRMIVENIINEKLSIWFDQNPSIIKNVINSNEKRKIYL